MHNITDDQDFEEVDVIASGYEWTCPNCEAFNKEIEITEIVCCDECHHKYRTGEAHHAHG